MEVEKTPDLEYARVLELRLLEVAPHTATARSVSVVLTDIWMATVKDSAARAYLTRTMQVADKILSVHEYKQFTGEAARRTSCRWLVNMKRGFLMAFAALTNSNNNNNAFITSLLALHPTFLETVYNVLSEYGAADAPCAVWGAGLVANVFYHRTVPSPRKAAAVLKSVLCRSGEVAPACLAAVSTALKTVGSTAEGLDGVVQEGIVPILEERLAKEHSSGREGRDTEVALMCLKRMNPETYKGFLYGNRNVLCSRCAQSLNLGTPDKEFFDVFTCEYSSYHQT